MAGWWYLTRACPEPVRRAQRHERAVELLVVRGEAELHGRGEELGLQRAHSCRETVRAGRHNSQQEAVPGAARARAGAAVRARRPREPRLLVPPPPLAAAIARVPTEESGNVRV